MEWKKLARNAATGVIAMAAVERMTGRHQERGSVEQIADLALGGLLAVGYSQLVPASQWGAESGLGFAQLPAVVAVAAVGTHRRAGGSARARVAGSLALWGLATGFLMRHFGQPTEQAAVAKLLPFRVLRAG